jgi:hypothetical protein
MVFRRFDTLAAWTLTPFPKGQAFNRQLSNLCIDGWLKLYLSKTLPRVLLSRILSTVSVLLCFPESYLCHRYLQDVYLESCLAGLLLVHTYRNLFSCLGISKVPLLRTFLLPSSQNLPTFGAFSIPIMVGQSSRKGSYMRGTALLYDLAQI